MARETARTVERFGDVASAPSPFILWEGGRDGSRDASAPGEADGFEGTLSMALETPTLFPERTCPTSLGREPLQVCDSTAAMVLPVAAPAVESRRPGDSDVAMEGRRRGLDWRMIGASLLLVLAMALGAMAVRGAALGAAYESLSWEDHRVVAGETIGSILANRDLPDVGLGRLVDWVEERNGLPDATILPGQTLSVPV